MPALTAADRTFLSEEWRWVEFNDPAIKTRHVGAREIDYESPFTDSVGAQAALNRIVAITNPTNRLSIVTIDGIPPASFKSRPRTVQLRTNRFGNNRSPGKLMLVARVAVDHGLERTTLHLIG